LPVTQVTEEFSAGDAVLLTNVVPVAVSRMAQLTLSVRFGSLALLTVSTATREVTVVANDQGDAAVAWPSTSLAPRV
jgi:hypothetical protein